MIKLKYKKSDGSIVAIGAMPYLQAGDDEEIAEFIAGIEIPRPIDHYRFDGKEIVKKTDQEIDDIKIKKEAEKLETSIFPVKNAILQAFEKEFTPSDLLKASDELDAAFAQAPTLNKIIRFFVEKIKGEK